MMHLTTAQHHTVACNLFEESLEKGSIHDIALYSHIILNLEAELSLDAGNSYYVKEV